MLEVCGPAKAAVSVSLHYLAVVAMAGPAGIARLERMKHQGLPLDQAIPRTVRTGWHGRATAALRA